MGAAGIAVPPLSGEARRWASWRQPGCSPRSRRRQLTRSGRLRAHSCTCPPRGNRTARELGARAGRGNSIGRAPPRGGRRDGGHERTLVDVPGSGRAQGAAGGGHRLPGATWQRAGVRRGWRPGRGQRVLTTAPGRRFASDDLVARLAAPLHRELSSRGPDQRSGPPQSFPGALGPSCWPDTAWVSAERSAPPGWRVGGSNGSVTEDPRRLVP
jgi:hypothetical protein